MSILHRIPKKPKNKDGHRILTFTLVIVHFRNRDIRNRIYASRGLLKLKKFSVPKTSYIFIKETLNQT